MKTILPIAILMLFQIASWAQRSDKVASDSILFEMLTQPTETQNWHPELVVSDSLLSPTRESGIYMVRGKSFQIASLNSSFYVKKGADGEWEVLHDGAYPLETMTNLLLNRIDNNRHQLLLHHHLYGGKVPRVVMPMQNLYDALARNMNIYCSVTAIDASKIKAILVFHHPRQDFIHLLQIELPTSKIMDKESTLEGDLYTNIPQGNIKSLFGK